LAGWGGDEFTILFTKLSGRDALLDAPLSKKPSNPLLFSKTIIYTSPIGISLYPQAGMNVDTLLKNADIALYRVKGSGRNTYNFYTATIPSPESNTQAIENPLNCAWMSNACCIISLSSICFPGSLAGVEVLLGRHSPELGWIPPDRFIPIAFINWIDLVRRANGF
jgi:predicted signal transduction protein with EAL and GGDEF domain